MSDEHTNPHAEAPTPLASFSLRAMLAFTVGLAIWLGWLTNSARQQKRAVEWVEARLGRVQYLEDSPVASLVPDWLVRAVGKDYVYSVSGVQLDWADNSPDEWAEIIIVNSRSVQRRIDRGKGSLRGIAPLADLNQLETLDVSYTKVTDLAPLADLKHLKYLALRRTSIDDWSVLSRLTSLSELQLDGSNLEDVSVLHTLSAPIRLAFRDECQSQ